MKTYIVDSFTDQPFKGNPAGVCVANQSLSEQSMLAIARELNFSETAFVVARDTPGHFSIRYFSPLKEIPLCGHATLASAKVLFRKQATLKEIRFFTGHELELVIVESDGRIEMEFPSYDLEPSTVPDSLLAALGLDRIIKCQYNRENEILMLEIESACELASLDPDFKALLVSYDGILGVSVTARSDGDFDFHSRFFWPWGGVDEDPVTGATHTFLAKYWGQKLGKTKMKSFQSSKRSGFMELELLENDRLLIRADAVILFEGDWVGEL